MSRLILRFQGSVSGERILFVDLLMEIGERSIPVVNRILKYII
jgi:hypothetical protein